MDRVAIYVRVSTEDQTYNQQIEPCLKFCEMKGWKDYKTFTEVQSTGKNRPVFRDVIRQAKEGKFTHILVFRLDRAWRSSREFIMDFDMLKNRGVYPISVMEGLDPTTPIGKAMMTILVALAELEKANISQATKERLQALKNLGKTLGRPKGSKDKKKRKTTGYLLREAKKRGNQNLNEKYSGLR